MKKIISLILALIWVGTAIGQTSRGKYIKFPRGNHITQIAVAISNGEPSFVLYVEDRENENYPSFNSESRFLLKFDDGTTLRLPIDYSDTPWHDDYWGRNAWNGKPELHYITYSLYPIKHDDLQMILTSGKKIVKTRIVLANGDIIDGEIEKKYQSKFIELLQESFKVAVEEDKRRKANMADEDF